ncbi:MAG: ECF transporter S component [Vallitaleaceae bacterium]|jgi:hypothetical protein|nr:ECF transporter S component [Vallitaleaceae bacterium]
MEIKKIARTGLMLAITLVFQIGFRQFAQPLVGPLVNMMLIFTTLSIGLPYAIIIGTLTPIVAFSLGIIGIFPIIPIIAIGNIAYVSIFFLMSRLIKTGTTNMKSDKTRITKNIVSWTVSILTASLVKYALLYGGVMLILPLVLEKVPAPIIAAFSLPQLYTALIGGVFAIIMYELIKQRIVSR